MTDRSGDVLDGAGERLRAYLEASAAPISLDEVRAQPELAPVPAGAPRGRRVLLIAAVVAVLALIAGAVVLVQGDGDRSPESQELETAEDPPAVAPPESGSLDALLHEYEWRNLQSGPLTYREDPVSLWTGDEWFLWGGSENGEAQADGGLFDPVADDWSYVPPAPLRWSNAAAFAIDGKIVIVDSRQAADLSDWASPMPRDGTTRVYAMTFDPETGSWSDPVANQTSERSNSLVAAAEYEGVVTALAALGPTNALRATNDGPLEVAAFDPSSNAWEQVADGPVAAEGLTVGVGRGPELLVWETHQGDDPAFGTPEATFETVTTANVLDLASGSWQSEEIDASTPTLRATPLVVGDYIALWGGEVDDPCPDVDALCPYGPGSDGLAPMPWAMVDGGTGDTIEVEPGPPNPGGVGATTTGDFLIARSHAYSAGIGDPDNPPFWQPGEVGLYDPATDTWHHLSGGSLASGSIDERGDVAPGGPGWDALGATSSATVWTGEELLVWTARTPLEETPGTLDASDPDIAEMLNATWTEVMAYGPAPDRSYLDACVPGEDEPAPLDPATAPFEVVEQEEPIFGPVDPTSDEPPPIGTRLTTWQAVGTINSDEPGFVPAALLGLYRAETTARPGWGAEIVDASCNLVGYWLMSGGSTLTQVTPEQYDRLDFRWWASAEAIDHPGAGQVVVNLYRSEDGVDDAAVFPVADPDWPLFADHPAMTAAETDPVWRPINMPDEDDPTRFRGGTIVGGEDTAEGTWSAYADLEPGDQLQAQAGYRDGPNPTRLTFEVTSVETIDSDDIEPLEPGDPVGLRLVIEHDDGTATVVDTRRWDDADFQELSDNQYEAELRKGIVDPVEEDARLRAQLAEFDEAEASGTNPQEQDWRDRQREIIERQLELVAQYLRD